MSSNIAGMDSTPTIRLASGADDRPFPELPGPVVVAEADGLPIAAVDLECGRLAGDPRQLGAGLVALLQLHRLEARLIGGLVGG